MYASVEPARQPYDKVEIGHVVGADDVPGSIPISGLSGIPVVLGHTGLELNIRGHVSITTIGNHVQMVLLLAASKGKKLALLTPDADLPVGAKVS